METVEEEICLSYPPKANAPGLMTLLFNVKPGNIMDYFAPRLELQMTVTFVLTQAIHFVLNRLRMPIFISQILVWITLGPMVFKHEDTLITMPEENVSILGTVANFGYRFFLFLTGLKMDFSMTFRSGNKALCIGNLTVLVPSIICLFMAQSAPEDKQRYRPSDVYVLAVAYSTTSFPNIDSLWSISGGIGYQDGPPLGSALVEKLDPVVSKFLMPLFASTCGMRIDFTYLNTHSIVEMAIFSNMYDRRVITAPIFAYMTLIIIVLASFVPMLVKALYDPSRKYASYQKRSIMHCKHHEELRMINCIRVPANVNSIFDILSTSTTESPIALHVLHLIKLSGRATPLFISHDMNQNTLCSNSYSENVVLLFKRFERDYWGAVSVKAFTAVSPKNMMYEDTCNLALDHHTSFIMLPFHRRWHFDADDTENMQDEIMPRNVKENCSNITHIEKQLSLLGDDTNVEIPRPLVSMNGQNFKRLELSGTYFHLLILVATILCFQGSPMETVKEEICLTFPPKLNIPGLMTLLSNVKLGNPMDYSAPRLELQIVVTFILTQAIHFVLNHLRMPILISQILCWCLSVCLFMVKSDQEEIKRNNEIELSVLAVSYSATSFPVIHSLLTELKLLNSELGRLSLSSALIGNMLSLFLLTICQGMVAARKGGRQTAIALFEKAIIFLVILVFCFRPLIKWMVRKRVGGGKINGACLYAAISGFMVSHKLTVVFGILLPYGPFLTGLAIQDGPPLGSALVEKLDPVVSGFLMPLFASTCGMRINFTYLNNSSPFVKHQALSAIVALIVKFGVSFLLSIFNKIPTRDSLAFAFVMISKGIVQMAIYSNMYDRRVLTAPMFAYMSLIVIVVASIVPVLVKTLYDPSKKYTLPRPQKSHCSSCASPYKLSGQATPLFISHEKNQYTLCGNSYSENVIVSFKRLERDSCGAISVKVFTAVSPTNMMYEDTCNLALDHHTSFIILPFHRRWHFDGSIELEDLNIRSLNCNMLERAPCSIGILVEGRHHLNCSNSQSSLASSSSYNIAVIFWGDEIMLRNVKENCSNITHIEKQASIGPETLKFLRSIVDKYHLFIVGRRFKREDPQTMGLHEWSEFQEIGIIGTYFHLLILVATILC
ncbi:putative Cation/H+ exchanger 4 [Hibiscus syriacus]|uniref:Cation/H+ exchanger 4 n=1 Tax=Hibiscus syriacus TaxID=106335 RepID=A0A6A2YTQ8_HIBSY|nr:putative Cation/H+ exchanger 4 [Hibiscus syriacus]